MTSRAPSVDPTLIDAEIISSTLALIALFDLPVTSNNWY